VLGRIRNRLTFANVVAVIALFIALGGSGMAQPVANTAANLGSSVKKALKLSKSANKNANKALSLARQANKNVSKVQSNGASQGPAGPPGPSGPAGGALAFARVTLDGTLDGTRSQNIGSLSRPSDGQYCFQLGFTPKNILATIENIYSGGRFFPYVTQSVIGAAPGCPPETEATVFTLRSAITVPTNPTQPVSVDGFRVNSPFFVGFN
jgi:hypothetical protein